MVKSLEKRSGKRYGVLVHGNRLLASAVFARLEIGSKLSSSDFLAVDHESAVEEALSHTVDLVTADLTQRFPESFPAVVFKNPTKSKALFDAGVNAVQSSQMALSLPQ
jgi:hypothetical protein